MRGVAGAWLGAASHAHAQSGAQFVGRAATLPQTAGRSRDEGRHCAPGTNTKDHGTCTDRHQRGKKMKENTRTKPLSPWADATAHSLAGDKRVPERWEGSRQQWSVRPASRRRHASAERCPETPAEEARKDGAPSDTGTRGPQGTVNPEVTRSRLRTPAAEMGTGTSGTRSRAVTHEDGGSTGWVAGGRRGGQVTGSCQGDLREGETRPPATRWPPRGAGHSDLDAQRHKEGSRTGSSGRKRNRRKKSNVELTAGK